MKIEYLIKVLTKLKYPTSFNDIKIIIQRIIEFTGNRPNFHFNFKIPFALQIELINSCNINCICCSAPINTRKKGYMSLSLFKKIIDEASNIGIKKIKPFLHGESFLHPRFIEMVRYIKSKKNLGIIITTNGSMLDEKKSKLLFQSGLDYEDEVVFSVLGYSKELHERVMQGIKHEDILTNIQTFLKLRRKYDSNVRVLVSFSRMPENEHEEKEFIKFWQKKVDDVQIFNVSKSFKKYKDSKIVTPQRNKTCSVIWKILGIYWNGDVPICITDLNGDFIVGNLKDQSIVEIWNGKQFSSVRNLHRKNQFKKIPLCSKCDF